MNTAIGKSSISTDHLAHRGLVRTKTKHQWGRNAIDIDAKILQQSQVIVGIDQTHQMCRHPVVRLCQCPFQRHHLSISCPAAISGCPVAIGFLHIGGHITGRHAVWHAQWIEERLGGRTDLSSSAQCHIIGEMGKIHSTHIRLYSASACIHTHKSRTQIRLDVSDGVERCHHGIHVTMIGEHRHLYGCLECFSYFLVRRPLFFHDAVSVTLFDWAFQYSPHLSRFQGIGKRRIGFHAVFLCKFGLQIATYMFSHRFFGITLHSGVDSGEYLQPIGIYVIGIAVFLEILVAPTIKRVVFPSCRVDGILHTIPWRIIAQRRFMSHHVPS